MARYIYILTVKVRSREIIPEVIHSSDDVDTLKGIAQVYCDDNWPGETIEWDNWFEGVVVLEDADQATFSITELEFTPNGQSKS